MRDSSSNPTGTPNQRWGAMSRAPAAAAKNTRNAVEGNPGQFAD